MIHLKNSGNKISHFSFPEFRFFPNDLLYYHNSLFFNNIINDYSPCKFQNIMIDFYKKTANDEFWGWNIDFVNATVMKNKLRCGG